jgi:hypothetical protein
MTRSRVKNVLPQLGAPDFDQSNPRYQTADQIAAFGAELYGIEVEKAEP